MVDPQSPETEDPDEINASVFKTDDAVYNGSSHNTSVRWLDEHVNHDDASTLSNPATSPRSTPMSSIRSNLSTSRHSNPSLHGGLMRSRKKRNPFNYFEVIEVLGVGSMGSVSKVKKKESAIGGSAREDYVASEHVPMEFCFNVPLVGPLVKICSGLMQEKKKRELLQSSSSKSLDKRKKDLQRRQSSIIQGVHKDIYYALKSIHLDCLSDESYVEELRNEVEILRGLDHPNIVRPIETFEHRNQMYILMELCSGGDLYNRDPYSELEAAKIVRSILSAVAYMHDNKITHRDLKYENIVFSDASPNAEIKIIDFGLSKIYERGKENMHETVGTVYTMAPEVLKNDYTNKADLWSIGVVAFMLLSSSMPFYGKKRTHVIEKILKCKYAFKGRVWKNISQEAKHFVWTLLHMNPDLRPTAMEASQHQWLSDSVDASKEAHEVKLMDAVQATLQNYSGYTTLKKLALMVVAHKSTSEEIGFIRNVFQRYDSLKNGIISHDEFKEALEPYGYSEDEVEQMFDGIDLDGTGIIHYTEFLAATIEAHGNITEERIAEAFDRLDCDDSGYITADNLEEFLGKNMPEDYIKAIIDEADLVRDHRVSYSEFLELWDDKYEVNRKEKVWEVEKRRLIHSSSSLGSSDSPRSRLSTAESDEFLGEIARTSSDDGSQPVTGSSLFRHEKMYSVRAFDM